MDGTQFPKFVTVARCLTLLLAMGGAAVALSRAPQEDLQRGGRGRSIAFSENKTYQAECAPCHLGFLPGFLPKRSWQKIMDTLEDHFGENAALDDAPREEILKYLLSHAADHSSSTRRSKKIAALIPDDESPMRITETAFWLRRHGAVREWVFKRESVGSKAKCNACHRDSEKGVFDDHDVTIPK